MLRGKEIKTYLVGCLNDSQPGKSSHWDYHLKDFLFDDEVGLKNISGFGGIVQRSLRERLYHFIMQYPDRKIGENFSIFNEVLSLGRSIAMKQNRTLDADMIRQIISLSFVESMLSDLNVDGNIDLVIGDGFGVLSSLINLYTGNKAVSINLNEVLLVDYLYTRNIVDDNATVLLKGKSDVEEALSDKKVKLIYIQAENHSLVRDLPIRVAYNLSSMQEMNPFVIKEYFEDMRNSKGKSLYFYCDNRVEKVLPDGTVVRFAEYPWNSSDDILRDELCPWHQRFYISSPLHRKFYLTRPPFYREYDGAHQHRLVRFNNI